MLSACAVGAAAWNSTSYAKSKLLVHLLPEVNPWAEGYFRSQDSALFNYAVLCLGMAAYGLAFHLGTRRGGVRCARRKARTLGLRHPVLLGVAAMLFAVVLNRHWALSLRIGLSLLQCLVLFVPVTSPLPWGRLGGVRLPPRWGDAAVKHAGLLAGVLTVLLVAAVSLEPIRLFRGPVHVINEFKEIPSDTAWNGAFVDNGTVLDAIARGGVRDEQVAAFVEANALEYFHQNASWGPFNHVGHVLNPLNEYANGKPSADVYMQYGQGNTLLLKWAMDRFGGLSVDNYYKCYLFYVVYAVLYLSLLVQLFRDRLQVFNAFAVYAIAFFGAGYSVFLHAPGVLPTIHLLDTTVFLLLLLCFRRGRAIWLGPALALAAFAVYMNRQFGAVLLISTGAACLPWLWERKAGRERAALLAMSVLLPLAVLAVPALGATANTGSTLRYFLLGYLSWRPDTAMVVLAILYLAVSYHFLLWIRARTDPLKYAFIFAFVYSQGLLAYYFWSGLRNHLMPVVPFVGLELILMVHIAREATPPGGWRGRVLSTGTVAVAAVLAAACAYQAVQFYRSKQLHERNFAQHRTYRWDFDRARVLSTIDPEPFRESVSLIRRYAPGEGSGIYLISTYDGVLPFLANRYSRMPFFEMQWFLITPREHEDALARLERERPEYLFVENGIRDERLDPWAPHFRSTEAEGARRANQARRLELGSLFTAVAAGYEKVEQGALLSVYRRR